MIACVTGIRYSMMSYILAEDSHLASTLSMPESSSVSTHKQIRQLKFNHET